MLQFLKEFAKIYLKDHKTVSLGHDVRIYKQSFYIQYNELKMIDYKYTLLCGTK